MKLLIAGNSTCSLAGWSGRQEASAGLALWSRGPCRCTGGSRGGAGMAFRSTGCECSPAALLIPVISSPWKPVTPQRVALCSSTPELSCTEAIFTSSLPAVSHSVLLGLLPSPKVPAPTKKPVSHNSVTRLSR